MHRRLVNVGHTDAAGRKRHVYLREGRADIARWRRWRRRRRRKRRGEVKRMHQDFLQAAKQIQKEKKGNK